MSQPLLAFNKTKGRPIAPRVAKAESLQDRMRGLLGRDSMDPDEGLWIEPCPQIHTFFMKFPIDVLFLDRALRVVRVEENLGPWRVCPWIPWVLPAHSVLELRGGALRGSVAEGDEVEFRR